MKTCLYNFDPFKPHFHIVKLGFTGVYIIFHISAQNIDCGYSLETPQSTTTTKNKQTKKKPKNKKKKKKKKKKNNNIDCGTR